MAFWLPKPVRSHNTSYSGTSAKPNAKLPSAKPSSFSVSRLLSAAFDMPSAVAHVEQDAADEDQQHQPAEEQRGAAGLGAPFTDLLVCHGVLLHGSVLSAPRHGR